MRFLRKLNDGPALLRRLAAFGICVGLLAGCRGQRQPEKTTGSPKESYQSVFSITRADANTDEADAVRISLDDLEGECLIQEAGTYLLSGELNGTVCVDAEEQIVHLILDGITVSSGSGPAILVRSAGKVIVTLRENTVNQVRDSGKYSASTEENACIYSVCDLTVNGAGSLNVHGYYKDGIHSKDVVKLLGGQITVQAKRDGIRGNDGFFMEDCRLDIQSEGAGLRTTKSGKEGKGSVEISGGELSVIAGEYAIFSADDLRIRDCGILLKGVYGDWQVQGETYVEEERLEDESIQT